MAARKPKRSGEPPKRCGGEPDVTKLCNTTSSYHIMDGAGGTSQPETLAHVAEVVAQQTVMPLKDMSATNLRRPMGFAKVI